MVWVSPRFKNIMYYVIGSEVLLREDRQTEFKGHKNISGRDIPPWLKPSKGMKTQSAISRALCGFLNTGEGGAVYIGVGDNGRVLGLTYTREQIDHMIQSISHTLSLYSPPVRRELWDVTFIPAIGNVSVPEVEMENHRHLKLSADKALDEYHGEDSPQNLGQHRVPHMVGNDYQLCWCEKNAQDLKNKGVKLPCYVAKITVHPFQPTSPIDLHPYYQDEEGTAYMRLTASLIPLTYQDVVDLTRQEIAALSKQK